MKKKQINFTIDENGKIEMNPSLEPIPDQLRGQYIPDKSLQVTFSTSKAVNVAELKALLAVWKKAVAGKKPVESPQHAPGAIAWKLERGNDEVAQQAEWNRMRDLASKLKREIDAKKQTAQQQPTQQAAKPAQQSTPKQTGAQPSAQQQKQPTQQAAKPAQQSTAKQTGAQPSAQQRSECNLPCNEDFDPKYDYFWRDFRSAHKEYFDPALSEDEQKEFVDQYWEQTMRIHSIFKK